LGSEVEGTVDSFASHGAFVTVDGARCYVPITGLGAPSLRSAKEVLNRGETRTFVVQALDPPRRGIELALPGLAQVAGVPTEETVAAEITEARPQKSRGSAKKKAGSRNAARPAKEQAAAASTPAEVAAVEAAPARATAKRPPAKKAATAATASKRSAPTKSVTQTEGAKAATKKVPARTAAKQVKKTPAKRAVKQAKQVPAKAASPAKRKATAKQAARPAS